jgi:aspartate/methionine/tyrosine aminotransferase
MNPAVKALPGAVFEKYRNLMAAHGDKLLRLHIGDTYRLPTYALPLDGPFMQKYPDFNRYCDTFGIAELRGILAQKVIEENKINADPDQILISCGATNALSAAVHAVLAPSESIMLLTPCWPIFRGIALLAGAKISEVPFFIKLYERPDLDIQAYLESNLTTETIAVYLNAPNNPSGKVLNREQVAQIAEFARRHNLWLISDEAYEGLIYDGAQLYSPGSLPRVAEQVITVFTFSKLYMFAGMRLGYAVAGKNVIRTMNKVIVHEIYGAPTFTQQMMIEAVSTRKEWSQEVTSAYQALRDMFVNNLRIPFHKPEATYFIFFRVPGSAAGGGYETLVRRCFDQGVSVAPGEDFGRDFSDYIRLCFNGETPGRLMEAIQRLNVIFNE